MCWNLCKIKLQGGIAHKFKGGLSARSARNSLTLWVLRFWGTTEAGSIGMGPPRMEAMATLYPLRRKV